MEGDWRNSAECKRADPELFFPDGERSDGSRQQIEEAKKYCVKCLVRNMCLQYALEMKADFGVWGGTTEGERKAIKRRAFRAERSPSEG